MEVNDWKDYINKVKTGLDIAIGNHIVISLKLKDCYVDSVEIIKHGEDDYEVTGQGLDFSGNLDKIAIFIAMLRPEVSKAVNRLAERMVVAFVKENKKSWSGSDLFEKAIRTSTEALGFDKDELDEENLYEACMDIIF